MMLHMMVSAMSLIARLCVECRVNINQQSEKACLVPGLFSENHSPLSRVNLIARNPLS
jgi:hypothetical protein